MRASLLFGLPVQRRAEIISLAFGILSFPVTLLLARVNVLFVAPGVWVLLPILFFSLAAGIASVWHPEVKGQPRSLATHQGARIGGRAGFLTAVVAGALTVVTGWLMGAPVASKWFYALMSMLPAMVIGMTAGAITARLRSPPEVGRASGGLRLSRLIPITSLHVLVGLFGFLFSPLFLPALFAPKQTVVETPPPGPPPPEPPPPPLPVYVYEYRRPAELDSAEPWLWEVERREPIFEMAEDGPVAISIFRVATTARSNSTSMTCF
jgi:hypothetical protein